MPDAVATPSRPTSPPDEFYLLAHSFAHEIRNPLNALQLHLKLLADEVQGSEKAVARVGAALREIKRLDELVSSFLRFARPRHPRLAPVDLCRVINELRDFVTPQFVKLNKELNVCCPAAVTITTDPDLLKQALLNIVLNAVDFSASRVSVNVREEGSAVTILVSDDGPGFQDPVRALLPYYSTKPDGIGLGLPSAQNIARALGGDVEILQDRPGGNVLIRLLNCIVNTPTD